MLYLNLTLTLILNHNAKLNHKADPTGNKNSNSVYLWYVCKAFKQCKDF